MIVSKARKGEMDLRRSDSILCPLSAIRAHSHQHLGMWQLVRKRLRDSARIRNSGEIAGVDNAVDGNAVAALAAAVAAIAPIATACLFFWHRASSRKFSQNCSPLYWAGGLRLRRPRGSIMLFFRENATKSGVGFRDSISG